MLYPVRSWQARKNPNCTKNGWNFCKKSKICTAYGARLSTDFLLLKRWNFSPFIYKVSQLFSRTQSWKVCHNKEQSPISHVDTNIFSYFKGNTSPVLMHSSIVNGYQLLCDAHTVPEQQKGTIAIFKILLTLILSCLFLFEFLSLKFLNKPPLLFWLSYD